MATSIYNCFLASPRNNDLLIPMMAAESNASSVDCFTVGDAKTTIAVFSVFGTIATLFYVAAILLIIKSRAHRQFVHRLSLYLAFGGLLRAATLWLTVAPVNIKLPDNDSVSLRDGWDGLCVFSAVLTQYSVFFQTLIVVWICMYVFVAVVFQKQLQRLRHEIAGIITVLLVPLMFTWEPFISNSYGLSGTRCWIKDSTCNSYDRRSLIYRLVVHIVPHLLLTLFGLALLLAAVLSLARKACARTPKLLGHQYWLAMKGILPLMLYPLFYSLIYLMSVISLIWGTHSHFLNVTGTEAFVAMIQMCSGLLLLSLLLGPRVRENICRRERSGAKGELLTASVASHGAAVS